MNSDIILYSQALAPRGTEGYATLVPLHQVIRAAIRQDNIKRSWLGGISLKEFIELGGDYEEIYRYLETRKGRHYYAVMGDLLNIFKSYFDIHKIEVTTSEKMALQREGHYTSNYLNKDGIAKGKKGTVWPNGLNDVPGGLGKANEFELPMIDIAAMLSLGLKYTTMVEILNNEYDKFGDFDKVYQEILAKKIRSNYGRKKDIYREFLLPVIEDLLIHDLKFTRKNIIDSIGWSKGKFSRHFGEMTLLKRIVKESGCIDENTLLRYLKASNLEKSAIQQVEGLYRDRLRGKSIEQWKKWAIEGTKLGIIGEDLGLSEATIHDTYVEISHLLTGIEGLTYREVQKYLRREIIIQKFGQGELPVNELAKKITKDVFKFSIYDLYSAKRAFENAFKNENGVKTMTYEQIVEAYYNKPRKQLGLNNYY